MAGARPVRCALSPTSTQPSAASKAGALIRFRARAIRVWASLGAAVSVSEEVGATAFDGAGTGAFASEEVSEVDTTGLGSGAVRARTSCIACSPFSPVKLRAEARAPISVVAFQTLGLLDEGAARAVGVQDAADAGARESLFGRGGCHFVEHRRRGPCPRLVGLGAHVGEYRAVGQVVAEAAPGSATPGRHCASATSARAVSRRAGGAAVKVAVVARGQAALRTGVCRRNAAGAQARGQRERVPGGTEGEHVNQRRGRLPRPGRPARRRPRRPSRLQGRRLSRAVNEAAIAARSGTVGVAVVPDVADEALWEGDGASLSASASPKGAAARIQRCAQAARGARSRSVGVALAQHDALAGARWPG